MAVLGVTNFRHRSQAPSSTFFVPAPIELKLEVLFMNIKCYKIMDQ